MYYCLYYTVLYNLLTYLLTYLIPALAPGPAFALADRILDGMAWHANANAMPCHAIEEKCGSDPSIYYTSALQCSTLQYSSSVPYSTVTV